MSDRRDNGAAAEPVTRLTVSTERRLDLFLAAELPGYSRAQVKALLRDGRVRVGGEVVRTGRRLAAGAVVEVRASRLSVGELPAAAPELPLDIAFTSPAVLVVNKPAGMPTLPLAPHERGTVANALVARHPEVRTAGGPPLEAGLVHRLDTDTSGLLLVARTALARRDLEHQLAAGQVTKVYLAVVRGSPPDSAVFMSPLAHDRTHRERMIVAEGGRAARTELVLRERLREHALVELTITTGARHQIRVHLAAAGFPIAGDRLYGDAAAPRPAERHFLHAQSLRFRDPSSGELVSVNSPLPAELEIWLRQLKGH
jgi:23S rRNA pseudouridine1911/1915/1917 synthase